MALDGIFVRSLKNSFEEKLTDTRLTKIQQPEPNEVHLTLKSRKEELHLVLTVTASLPLAYFTALKKESPLTAPSFLMVLRKHLQNARFIRMEQPSLERALYFVFEHADEMGDLKEKRLAIEFMGKYSNIILINDENKVIDAIRHVSPLVSSVRTVLPGSVYFLPDAANKLNPLEVTREAFREGLSYEDTLCANICNRYTGLSQQSVSEWLLSQGLYGDEQLSADNENALENAYFSLTEAISEGRFTFNAVFRGRKPVSFSALPIVSYESDPDCHIKTFDSPSELLETYFSEKATEDAVNAKTTELHRVLKTLIEREAKKCDLYEKQLQDTLSRDKFKLYGELLTAYQYSLTNGQKSVTVNNYYDNTDISIPMDPDLSVSQNAKRYYDKYNKLKRTYAATTELLKESRDKLEHLQSIKVSVNFLETSGDLKAIKDEMVEAGYMKHSTSKKPQKKEKSKPLHYVSSDGFDIYVGKNNLENDELTFKFAKPQDLFFHAKKAPGSHVILVTEGKEVPDRTYEEAARIAAFYSSKRNNDKVEIDYVEKKEVKKPNGAKPGFVVYYTNYSMMAETDISAIRKV